MNRIVTAVIGSLTLVCAIAADAQISTNASNSVVRFSITYGANFLGDIDVELFDLDKPITTYNFLSYVQGGLYANSLLSRCVPGFVLQGGGWTILSPTSSSAFERAVEIPAGPLITNEFAVGTLRSNVLGTLAMARPSGQPNAATSQWFFNLGDNSDGSGSTNLNKADGGYTVFGRVTAGTPVLEFFNSLSANRGVLDMKNPFYQNNCSPVVLAPNGGSGFPFEALPVSFTNDFGCPFYNNLFTVQVIFLSGRDALPPRLTISQPAADASLTNENVLVKGTVSDNAAVASVRVYWHTNGPLAASIMNDTWTVTLTNVPPGTNSIIVEAIDTSGIRAQVARSFFRSVRVPLTLGIVGHGRVTGATNQQLLELKRGHSLTAVADRGNLFVGWTGDIVQESPKLTFLMDSNTSIVAVFATNLFPNVKGSYTGLFYNTSLVEQESSGLLTLTVGNGGVYSGKVLMNGRSHSFRGVFSPDGRETNFVTRPGTNALLLELTLDLTNDFDHLTGFITNNQLTGVDTNQGWRAELMADRAVFNAQTNRAPQAGRYTMLIPAGTNSVAGPPADGFGAVAATTAGAISLAGTLADGTKVTQKTPLAKRGQWPLYVALYKDKGALLGWVTFTNEPGSDFTGRLNWFKQNQPKVRYYPGGFTNEAVIAGSRFVPPPTNRVINLTNSIVGFANGNLMMDFSDGITLSADGKATYQGTNKLKFSITKSSGLFSGSVTPPGARKPISFKGAVLQSQNLGSGLFLGTNQSGRVSLGP